MRAVTVRRMANDVTYTMYAALPIHLRVQSMHAHTHTPTLSTGRFNLDPNRVLGVLMEACACYHDDGEVFLALLRGYPCEQATFVNVLGFKFQSCQVY